MNTDALKTVIKDMESDLDRARKHQERLRRDLAENEAMVTELSETLEPLRRRLEREAADSPAVSAREAVAALMQENPSIDRNELIERLGPHYEEFRDAGDPNVKRRASQYMLQAPPSKPVQPQGGEEA